MAITGGTINGTTIGLTTPAAAVFTTGQFNSGVNISSGQTFCFNSDTGISRSAAMTFDFGACTQGSANGTLQAVTFVSGTAAGYGSNLAFGSGQYMHWSSSTAYTGTVDTVLCRSGAGVLEIGAGTSCAASGSLLLSGLTLTGPFFPPQGASNPGICSVGQVFYNTAATAGQNLYGCTATNTWTQLGGSGGSGVSSFSAPSASWPTWLVPTVTSPTSAPSLAVAASAIPNSALANPSLTLAGHTVALGGTQTIACTDLTGSGTACSANTGTSGATVPLLNANNTYSGSNTHSGSETFTGSLGAPDSASLPGTCTVGQVYFLTGVTAGSNWYGCTATNTWTQLGGSGGGTINWARSYQTASQTIPVSASTDLTFDTNDPNNTAGIHSTTVNPAEFIAPSTGPFAGSCSSTTTSTAGGALYITVLWHHSGTDIEVGTGSEVNPGGSGGPLVVAPWSAYMTAGDYVHCQVYSVSGITTPGSGNLTQMTFMSTGLAGGGGGGSGITQLTGDVTAGPGSGSQAATVVQVNGAAIPASQSCLGSDSGSHLIAGTCSPSGFNATVAGQVLSIAAGSMSTNVTTNYAASTCTLSGSTSGVAYVYVDSTGALTVGSLATFGSCTGPMTYASGITAVPANARALWTVATTSGAFSGSPQDLRANYFHTVINGTAVTVNSDGSYTMNNNLPYPVPLSDLATQVANTVVGNGTGSTAAPTALAMPSCSSGSSALTWTSGTGFGCNTISGSGTVNSGTASHLAYYAGTGTAVSDMGSDFLFTTHTLTGGASAILDLSATSPTAGLKLPSAAGAVPTADGFIAVNTTTHALTWGSNGTTIVGASAGTGTASGTTCTNQWVSALSATAAPTCSTVTYLGTVTNGTWHATVIGSAYGGTGVNNTATLTLGTSNQNWATLGTGLVKNTTTTGALSNAAGSDIVSLVQGLTGCNTATYVFTPQASDCVAPSGGTTLNNSGYGGGFTGTTTLTLYVAPQTRTVSGTTDAPTQADCGGEVIYTSSSLVSISLPNPTTAYTSQQCNITLLSEGAGGLSVTATGSTIGGSGSPYAVAGGTALAPYYVALNSNTSAAAYLVGPQQAAASSGGVTSVTGVAPIASTGGATPTISLQNSAAANVTSSLGTDTKIFTASGAAAGNGNVMTGDAQGGIHDSGANLSSLAPLSSPAFTGTVVLPLTTAGLVTTTSGGTISSESNTSAYVNLFETICTTPGCMVYGGAAGTPTGLAPNTTGSTDAVLTSTSVSGAYSSTSLKNAPALSGTNFTGVPNGALANSAITIGGTSVSLGGSTSSLPSPGAIGGTTPAPITGTTIQANTQINAGTAGTLAPVVFGNATSGALTLQPVTGALGAVTASLPANTGTIAELNLAQTWSAIQTVNAGDLTLTSGSAGAAKITPGAAYTGSTDGYLNRNNATTPSMMQVYDSSTGIAKNITIPGYATFSATGASAAVSATTLFTPSSQPFKCGTLRQP